MAKATRNEFFFINGEWVFNTFSVRNEVVEVDNLANLKVRRPAHKCEVFERVYVSNKMIETRKDFRYELSFN